jgi:hypothetical protein
MIAALAINPGKPVMQNAAAKILVYNLGNNRP